MKNETVRKRLNHTRIETPNTIKIVWNSAFTITMYAMIAFIFLGIIIGGKYSVISYVSSLVLMLQFVYSLIYYIGISKEVKAAQKGKVTVKGNKFSLKDPLTTTIKK